MLTRFFTQTEPIQAMAAVNAAYAHGPVLNARPLVDAAVLKFGNLFLSL